MLLAVSLALFMNDRISAFIHEKKAAQAYEELKESVPDLGYRHHRILLAKLEKMSASEFYATVDSRAVYMMLEQWYQEELAYKLS